MSNETRRGVAGIDTGRADAIRSAIIARCVLHGVSYATVGRIVGLSKAGIGARVAKASSDELKRPAAVDLGDVLRPAV